MLLFHVLDAPYLITATDFHAYDFSINRLQLFEDLMTNQIFKETFFSDKGNKLSHSIKLLVVFQPLLLDEFPLTDLEILAINLQAASADSAEDHLLKDGNRLFQHFSFKIRETNFHLDDKEP